MPRTAIPVISCTGAYPTAGTAFLRTAADVGNQNSCPFTGKEVILAFNSGSTTRTVTVVSVADDSGRTGDLTFTLASGINRLAGPFAVIGWGQTDGSLYFGATHAEVLFTVLRVP